MMDQRGASVWPYIALSKGYGPNNFHMMISNNGIGPAKIQRFEYDYEGQIIYRIQNLLGHILDQTNLELNMTYTNVESDDTVLKLGEEVQMLLINSDTVRIGPILNEAYQNINITIEYCSIYDKCWRIENGDYTEL